MSAEPFQITFTPYQRSDARAPASPPSPQSQLALALDDMFHNNAASRARDAALSPELRARAAVALGADPNHDPDGDGRTYLIKAVAANSMREVRTLIALGADIERTCDFSMDALSVACLSGKDGRASEGVALLLQAGARVDKAYPSMGQGADVGIAEHVRQLGARTPGLDEALALVEAAALKSAVRPAAPRSKRLRV